MYEFVHRRGRLHGFWRVLMRIDADPVCDTPRHFGIVTTVSWLVVLAGFLTVGFAPPAQALPSFARQTGQPCGACHTDFAGLTPFGRRFKIGGYTMGGGSYRTTLFPSDDSGNGDKKDWVPPISMMAIAGFTNTQASLPPP